MSNFRNSMTGGYERQLGDTDIAPSRKIWLGLDNITAGGTSWEYTKVYFASKYNIRLLSTRGMRLGARGAEIGWAIPARVARTTDWVIEDYDQDLIDTLTAWQADGAALRLFVSGLLWLRCYIKELKRKAPLTKTIQITTLNRKLFVYKSRTDLGFAEWNRTNAGAVTLNNPFLAIATYGHVYGEVADGL